MWNDRGKFLRDGVAMVGSNVVDLANDFLRKIKKKGSGRVGAVSVSSESTHHTELLELVGNSVRISNAQEIIQERMHG